MKFSGHLIYCIRLGLHCSYNPIKDQVVEDRLRYIMQPLFKVEHDWDAWLEIFPDLAVVKQA